MNQFDLQLESVKTKYPNVLTQPLASGAILVILPKVNLPSGWNKAQSDIKFLAPVGYPFATPDCFWAEQDLRLENGALPQASNTTPIPETNDLHLWFSWHVQNWNANRDNLLSYIGVINNRLLEAK